MPSLKEIIAFPVVTIGDKYDIDAAMSLIAREDSDGNFSGGWGDYEGNSITYDIKVDVHYDHRRGAQAGVLRYNTVPFAVVSRAGRELDDTEAVYILDAEYASKALLEWATKPQFDDIYNPEAEIELKFWEGTPVELGDKGRKGDLLG